MLRRIFPDEFAVIAVLLTAALSFAWFGCADKPSWQEPGPEATFEQFLMDWFRGQRESAFAAIDPSDRTVLTAPLDDLDGKLDAANLPDESDMLVVGRVDNPYDIKDIDVAEPLKSAPDKGQKVELELSYNDGSTGKATMIWGGKRWYVDLPVESSREQQGDGYDQDK